jgi:hypothetical protein
MTDSRIQRGALNSPQAFMQSLTERLTQVYIDIGGGAPEHSPDR